jgi:hypothetical protein
MKKYLLSSIALIIALSLSSFMRKIYPLTNLEFKLAVRPIFATSVSDPSNWITSGTYFGACFPVGYYELACKITLNTSTMTDYYHEYAGAYILNTYTYANSQNPKKNYLEIGEIDGILVTSPDPYPGQYRCFDSMFGLEFAIIPKKYNTLTSSYENDNSISRGTDYFHTNAKYKP